MKLSTANCCCVGITMKTRLEILKKCKTKNVASRGLVVMFGWTGAQHRHVKHHAKMWTKRGFDGIVFRFLE